jgi:aryl-alcohol dehydrogenase-like predicted oxidoreductase
MTKLDEYRTLGRSGLRVSRFCLGTMTFGSEWGFGADEETCAGILDHYLGLGGNFIDTANTYTNGHSEAIIGEQIGRDRARRDRVVIATKFGANLYPDDANGGGANRKSIIAACEQSLRRLQTDYIDLYWLHWWDRFVPVDETMRALDDLVSAGKIRYAGFSDTPAWKVAQAQVLAECRGWSPLVGLQIEYSLLERTVEGELVPMARELGLGILPWSPLRSGVLTGKYSRDQRTANSAGRQGWIDRNLTDAAFAVNDVLRDVADELGTTPARVAIAWVLAQPGVTSPIVGVRTIEQLDDNLAALDITLGEEALARLDKVSRPTLNFPAAFLRGAAPASYGPMTINGERFAENPMASTRGKKVY